MINKKSGDSLPKYLLNALVYSAADDYLAHPYTTRYYIPPQEVVICWYNNVPCIWFDGCNCKECRANILFSAGSSVAEIMNDALAVSPPFFKFSGR